MSNGTALRFWQTVRWLKPQQIWGRVWFRLVKPRIELRPAPPLARPSGDWVRPARRRPSLMAPERLCFLNRGADLNDCGWDNPADDKLWRYNLHYFDDLNAEDAETRRAWHHALLLRWLEGNPPDKGGTGWEPYPISLRVVNWIKWALGGETLDSALIDSLATQVRHLSQRLEIHLLGNHLFANAKALIFAGLFFDGPEARKWCDRGFLILERETREQILDDGGQFELSPMYHALALEDVLDLINVCRCYGDALTSAQRRLTTRWEAIAVKMRGWLSAMTHPDGEIAFFNDAAFGVAPPPAQLQTYAEALSLPSMEPGAPFTHLSESGYVRFDRGPAVLLCDMARVGPDYLPGHAHADTLSFELSLFDRRTIVNSGTSTYAPGNERLRQRGTAAHNSVIVAGQNSSDVWSSFRVGRRARPLATHIENDGDGQTFAAGAAHDGYRQLSGHPRLHRRWELRTEGLRIIDTVPVDRYRAQARYHLHPDVAVQLNDEHSGQLVLADGRIVNWIASGGPASVEESTWHPEFGTSIPNRCLVLTASNQTLCLDLQWN